MNIHQVRTKAMHQKKDASLKELKSGQKHLEEETEASKKEMKEEMKTSQAEMK
jgi:hypothetical protein